MEEQVSLDTLPDARFGDRPIVGSGLSFEQEPHEIYRKRKLTSFLNQLDLDLLELSNTTLDRFDQAALKKQSQVIGEWIEANRQVMGKSHEKIAIMMDVDVSTVTKWINGDSNISQKNLTKLRSRFSKNGIPLILPEAENLILEGYRAAVAHVRSVLSREPSPPPRGEELLCLHHLYSEPSWEKLRIDAEVDCMFRSLARSILERAGLVGATSRPCGDGPCRVAAGANEVCPKERRCGNLDEVKLINTIINKWGLAWLVCIQILPVQGDT